MNACKGSVNSTNHLTGLMVPISEGWYTDRLGCFLKEGSHEKELIGDSFTEYQRGGEEVEGPH